MKEYYVQSVKIGKQEATMEMSEKWGEYGEESFSQTHATVLG